MYIHIPFCMKKCRYCDFFSAPASFKEREQYVTDLVRSIYEQAKDYTDYEVISLFFGGGTPSILTAEQIAKIMEALQKSFAVRSDAEITIEVNPGTVDYAFFEAIRKMGINRVSIGLQSANNEELKFLGRIHTYEDFLRCFEDARKAGFDNLNVDLISSLPGQNLLSYQKTLEKVIALKPEHISAYSLIMEENTQLYDMFYDASGKEKNYCENGKTYELLSEEADREIYHLTKKVLREHGYERYEISNYSLPGKECRHNLVYWHRGEYLGLGAKAASLVRNERFVNEDRFPFSHTEKEVLSKEDQMAEFMFLGLRTIKGVSMSDFSKQFQVGMNEVYEKQLEKLLKEGLIEIKRDSLQELYVSLTDLGLDVSNYAMAEFI